MADQQKVVYDLSNGAISAAVKHKIVHFLAKSMKYIFNDLEQPLTQFSRSRYILTLNISQTVKDTATVTMKGEQETAPKLSNSTSLHDLE